MEKTEKSGLWIFYHENSTCGGMWSEAGDKAHNIGVWGARWHVSSSDIDLLSGQDRPMKIDFENFFSAFFG